MKNIPINKALLAYHQANRYTDIFVGDGLIGKKNHIANVISQTSAIAAVQHLDIDHQFLQFCAEHHDDGRVNQYEILGKFWDTEISHNVLSLDRLDKFLANQENLVVDTSVLILRDVMLYHGRMWLTNLSPESKPYVEVITAADDFENALSCVSYLVREKEEDAKGYIKSHPESDQTTVSPFVWEHFCQGEKFDKAKYCQTYGEYVLFAATLATNCIKKYGDLTITALSQPGYGYSSILEGFRDVFQKTLDNATAKKAFEVLESMVY